MKIKKDGKLVDLNQDKANKIKKAKKDHKELNKAKKTMSDLLKRIELIETFIGL